MLQAVLRGAVADDQDFFAVIIYKQILQKTFHTVNALLVTLPFWKRRIDKAASFFFHFARRIARQLAIIAFPQARVLDNGNVAVQKGDLGGFVSAPQIRAKNRGEIIVCIPLAQFFRLLFAQGRKLDVVMPGR